MDIKEKIEELAKKITGDGKLLEKFKSDPIGTVKELLGKIDLPDGALDSIVSGIKAKIGSDKIGGLLDKAKGLLD